MNNYQPRAPHPGRTAVEPCHTTVHATSCNTQLTPGEGIRIEELTELAHSSLVQYRVPTSGELVPLLHIAPSKTDTERLLVISPELADVLSAVVTRVRDHNGAIPLISAYDYHERVFNPPLAILFQRRVGTESRPVTAPAIRKLLDTALSLTGLTGTDGQTLRFLPHDFRRLFITDAVMNGMPPHITQLVVGHQDINTTMGYKAVYPEEAINGHRAFIARRRALRPSQEYRTPTEQEWKEFLGHFQRRRVALGDCGRAYGTNCIHEHGCLRCSLLRPDPAQRPRLVQIRDNLRDRITEAQQKNWLGEVEGLASTSASPPRPPNSPNSMSSQPAATPSTWACRPSPNQPVAPSPFHDLSRSEKRMAQWTPLDPASGRPGGHRGHPPGRWVEQLCRHH